MKKITAEELAYTARWGYKHIGRGLVIITSQRKAYYLSATQSYTFFQENKRLADTELADQMKEGLRTYNPITHFLVLIITEEEVTLLMGEYGRNTLDV